MVATVVIVVWSDNLAAGVIAGVVLSGLFFASKVRRMFTVDSTLSADHRTRAYRITGEIFFASAERFDDAAACKEVLAHDVIDLIDAHFWDINGGGSLDKAVFPFRRTGTSTDDERVGEGDGRK